jgi:hypothetical protein
MGFWKGLVDKVAQKREELEDEAKKRAAKKAAEMALGTGKAAAKAAVRNAGKTLDYAGKKLEEALFGEASSDDDEAPASSKPTKDGAATRPDPFAKLKAEEAARKASAKEREQEERAAARARDEARARTEREVDDELAALKKKIRGQ